LSQATLNATDASLLDRALAASAAAPEDPTTERILDSALQEFIEFGLRRTTVEDVARRAHVARMTIYRRFQRKEGLVEAVVLREMARFLVGLDDAVMRGRTVEDRLAEGFAFGIPAAREHPLFSRLLETEPDAFLPYVTVDGGPLVAAATEFVATKVIGAGPGDEDARTAAEVLVRLAQSLVLLPQSSLPADEYGARELARRLIAALLPRSARTAKRAPQR
jgi:TetR/AcrR family transcriptional regulator, repressor for uid operon